MSEVLIVIEWARFQHYKDRDPPWIKLYRDILTSEAWVVGTDLSRLVQIAIMLLAARYQNAIPYRFDLIKKVTCLSCTQAQFKGAISHLTATGFIAVQAGQVASTALAARYKNASPEGESEERREETEAEAEAERARARPPGELDEVAWQTWTQYRVQIKKPLKGASIPVAQRLLAKFAERQLAVVEQSIGNGWVGLFDLKVTNGTGKAQAPRKTRFEELTEGLQHGDEK